MNILLIPDKFKGSATAEEVVSALTNGVLSALPEAQIYNVKASDGGEGFLNAIAEQIDANIVFTDVKDPLNNNIKAWYLYDDKSSTAYIELAKASGMQLLSQEEQNPMETSTYGTGQQIIDALQKGAKKVVIGLGGSATSDGGIGMAAALGYVFCDENGDELKPIGKNLIDIKIIKSDKVVTIKNVDFVAVNDVDNPLYGKNGAAHIYGPQKGATKKNVVHLNAGLKQLHKVVLEQFQKDNAKVEGTGAAGGAAYGLRTFFNAEFISGVDFIFELAQVSKRIANDEIDIIITGEGKIDAQTLNGKLVKGVTAMGKKAGIPVIGVCGKLELTEDQLKELGLFQALEVSDASKPLEYNMNHAPKLIENAVYEYFKR